MDITKAVFKRQFSMSMYKNLKLPLGRMTFTKDFVTETKRGDLYPVLYRSETCHESVEHNCYRVSQGIVERVIGQFFPYASYEMHGQSVDGAFGFGFQIKDAKAIILKQENSLRVAKNKNNRMNGVYIRRAIIWESTSQLTINK